jgi:hypothetical protein
MQTFDPKKLNDTEIKEQSQAKVSDRLAGFESLNDYYDLGKLYRKYKNFNERGWYKLK